MLLCRRNIFFCSLSLPLLPFLHYLIIFLIHGSSGTRAYGLFLLYTHFGTKVRKTDRSEKRKEELFAFFLLEPFDVCTCVCIVQLFLFFFFVFFFLIAVVHCRFFLGIQFIRQREREKRKKK
jgi:hypothetical protein